MRATAIGDKVCDDMLSDTRVWLSQFIGLHSDDWSKHPVVSKNASLHNAGTWKGSNLLGYIAAGRPEVRPFNEKQIAL